MASRSGSRPARPASTPADHVISGEQDLATALSDVAQALQQQVDVETVLQTMVDSAVDAIPGAEHASVSSIVHRRDMTTRAATGDLPREADRAQVETGQGPCLDALYEQRTARVPDLAAEDRWPDFAARALALGVGSMLALQLFVRGDDLGALNLFSSRPDAFTDESEHVGLLFASHAAIAMSDAQEQRDLRGAIEFRDLIGQAKGILMERYGISADRAFQVLTRTSQDHNIKLRDVATRLVFHGSLDQP